MALLCVTGTGCAKFWLPLSDLDFKNTSGNGGGEAIRTLLSASPAIREKCEKDGEDYSPLRLAHYPALRQWVADTAEAPDTERPGLERRLHREAMRKTIDWLRATVRRQEPTGLAEFDSAIRRYIGAPGRRQADMELARLFSIVGAADGSGCSRVLLSIHYNFYALESDSFATVAVGGLGAATVALALAPAEGEWAAASLEEHGETGIIRLRNFDHETAVSTLIPQIEAAHQSGRIRSWLIDLRSSSGAKPEILSRLTESSRTSGWGSSPNVVWVDRQTRGTPELFAAQQPPSTLVAGERTAGYTRRLCTSHRILGDGLPEMYLATACGSLPGGEGLQGVGVRPRLPLQASSESVRERRRLGVDRQLRFFSGPGSEPSSVAASPEPVDAEVASLISEQGPATLDGMAELARRWRERPAAPRP